MIFFKNKVFSFEKKSYFLYEKTQSFAMDLNFALIPFISNCK